jgi:hypothetical protein
MNRFAGIAGVSNIKAESTFVVDAIINVSVGTYQEVSFPDS